MASPQISVYNLADLKNTTDDAIPNYLNSLKFKQSFALIDTRLALGYSAFAIAAACFGWDYKFGFENTKYLTAAAVALYSLINGALSLWVMFREKGTIYEGTAPSGQHILVSSSTKKNIPIYNLTVTVTEKNGKKSTTSLSLPFADWFDEMGHFVALPFQKIMATKISLVGQFDTRHTVKKEQASTSVLGASPEVLDALLAASTASEASSSTAATPAKKGASKRRKA